MKIQFFLVALGLLFWCNKGAAQSKTIYNIFCCKNHCTWSNKTTDWDEAQEMERNHAKTYLGHGASLARINPAKMEKKYKVVCSECSWESPTTTSYLDGDNIETCHERENTGHYARIIDSNDYIDID
jgi:hypothetical protein